MPDVTRTLSASFADWPRLDSLLNDWLEDFHAEITKRPHTERQEMHGLAICWVATFLPEACTPEFQAELARVALLLRERADHRHEMWWRVPPLEAALFALTGDRELLRFLIPNINHGASDLRTPIIEALGFVAGRMDFHDGALRERVLSNLKSRQALDSESLLILLSSRGSVSDKMAWLESNSAALREDDMTENSVLAELRKSGYATNDWFPVILREPLLFIAAELARPHQKRGQIPLQLEAFERPEGTEPAASGDLFGPSDIWGLLSERFKAHALSSPVFRPPNN